jgi:FixJ family two-component response regulator
MTGRQSPLTVVVVDDDERIRRAIGRLLRSHGHIVHSFDSAEAYLARACRADCAILDIELPNMNGLELAARLRADSTQMPVVFVTAHDELHVLAAVQQTHSPLLKKPVDEEELLDAIARAVSSRV